MTLSSTNSIVSSRKGSSYLGDSIIVTILSAWTDTARLGIEPRSAGFLGVDYLAVPEDRGVQVFEDKVAAQNVSRAAPSASLMNVKRELATFYRNSFGWTDSTAEDTFWSRLWTRFDPTGKDFYFCFSNAASEQHGMEIRFRKVPPNRFRFFDEVLMGESSYTMSLFAEPNLNR